MSSLKKKIYNISSNKSNEILIKLVKTKIKNDKKNLVGNI